jgi:hypothetical protein
MGPLKTIIQTALFVRLGLSMLMRNLGFPQWAPHPSYAVAMRCGVPFKDVYKNLLRETAAVTTVLIGLAISFVRYALDLWSRYKYIYA